MLPFAYFQNRIVPVEEAKISIGAQGFNYGTVCIGGMRGYLRGEKRVIFRPFDHYQRLYKGVRILGLELPNSWDEFKAILIELTKRNAPTEEFYIRPLFYSPDCTLRPRFVDLSFELSIYLSKMPTLYDIHRGLRLAISSWRKINDSAVSTKAKLSGTYINAALAYTDGVKRGVDDVLVTDESGAVVEGATSNLFITYRGRVYTPECGLSMLDGITKESVIELLKAEGVEVIQGVIDRSMVYSADELLLTGTAMQIAYGTQVDDRPIGDGQMGPLCKLLRKRYSEIIAGEHPRSKDWLLEI